MRNGDYSMVDFEPINFNLQSGSYNYSDNVVNTNRWSVVVSQKNVPQGPIWDIPVKDYPEEKSIGKELTASPRKKSTTAKKTKAKPKPQAAPKPQAPKPQASQPKIVEEEGLTPPEEEQTSKQEKERLLEEKTIKGFSALSDVKMLSDEQKLDVAYEMEYYIDSLAENATFYDTKTNENGAEITFGTTKNGNSITITRQNKDGIETKTTVIRTKDGDIISHLQITDGTTYSSGVTSGTPGENNTLKTSALYYKTDLSANNVTKISVFEGMRDSTGEVHTSTTEQTYNPDGSKGPAAFNETVRGTDGNESSHVFTGTVDENGDFQSNGQIPDHSGDSTDLTFITYESEGNATSIQEDFPQPQNERDEVSKDTEPNKTSQNPRRQNGGQQIHSSTPRPIQDFQNPDGIDSSEPEYTDEPLPPPPGEYYWDYGQTNLLDNAATAFRRE